MIKEQKPALYCYHCGESCETGDIIIEDKHFCCQGCKTVYEILNKVQLCDYYAIQQNPGLSQKTAVRKEKFAFLDDELLQQKLTHFKDSTQSHITFYLPQMHCSSCIWLLEHLCRLDKNILSSQVNFLKKELTLVFDHRKGSVRKIAELLTSIGYEPHFSLHDLSDKKKTKYDKGQLYKIGITGFCFGNIMLMSFPEYFGLNNSADVSLTHLFSWLNLGLALPVFFYGASGFFISAWKSLRQKFLNIDAPIALAIFITFVRSVYEISGGHGAGYLDSMSGIVFFMLVGRYFQGKTYSSLTFNRDYTSYFPLGVTVLDEQGNEKQVPVSDLQKGHRIKVHSGEIIPADCILFFGQAHIDYSFVTGESLPVDKSMGEIIYAGGKQTGGALEMEVVKEVSQSYLTQLWNNDAFRKKEEKNTSYIHRLSRYFTLVLFSVALTAGVYWQFTDPSRVWNAVTAVLIVACPCALLLSAAFTNGHMLRVLQKFGFYARNAGVIEKVSSIDTLVFDKTGTITRQEQAGIKYEGEALNPEIAQLIRSLASQSAHPLSKAIVQALPASVVLPVKHFQERPGYGITGRIGDHMVIIGSAAYTRAEHLIASRASGVYIKIDGRLYGKFSISIQYRKGLERLFAGLKKHFGLSLLSGDNDAERDNLKHLFSGQLLFGQSPQDKLNYIRSLQAQDHRVLMLGDGLNDAGALKQSDIGIAVTDNINNFSPACDVILAGSSFHLLDSLLWYCRKNKQIINSSFVVSILYNLCGLYFAVQGQLQPVIAAVLMPVSSISIVLLTTGMSSLFAMRLKKTQKTDVDHVLS